MTKKESDKLMSYIVSLFGNAEEKMSILSRNDASAEMAKDVALFLDEIPGGFFIYHADGNEELIYANNAMARIFGCDSIDEFRTLVGNSFKGIVHPADLKEVEESIVQQIEESQFDLDYVEYRIRRKDGSIRWVEDYGHFVHDETQGDLFYVFITDATEKIEGHRVQTAKLIEARDTELKSLIEEYDKERKIINQEHLRRLEVIEGLSVDYESILYVDLTGKHFIVYRAGERAVEQLKAEPDVREFSAFIKSYVEKWVHPEDKEKVLAHLSSDFLLQKLSKDKTYYLNYRCVSKGSIEYLQLHAVAVGNEYQIVLGFRKIDDEVNQAIRQRDLMEKALEDAKLAANVKDVFLSNMSHDMRTPLNAIFGYTQLAKASLASPDVLSGYLDKIENSANTILELVQKVLELSNMKTKNSTSNNEEPCNLLDVLNEVKRNLSHKAMSKSIDFVVDFSKISCVDVMADKDKLSQVLVQLVDNAIKYTREGGRVCLEAAEMEKSVNGYTMYRFSVVDNGMGIGEKALATIFEPFEREFNSTSSGELGFGIGLTIAKNYVEVMGGKIDVNSVVDKGSVFTVTVGFRSLEQEEITDESVLAEIKKKKILIVDDNEINLEIEYEILADMGFSVEKAENGQIALDKLTARPAGYYAVILMDIQMPVMNGWEATQCIRHLEDPALAHIPIIAVSANYFEKDRLTSMQVGMDEHLPKPIDVQQLVDAMAKIVATRKKK